MRAAGPPREISIHALREEGDDVLPVWCRLWGLFLSTPSARRATVAREALISSAMISIHALREEGDMQQGFCATQNTIFLSTPSARRATTGCRRM